MCLWHILFSLCPGLLTIGWPSDGMHMQEMAPTIVKVVVTVEHPHDVTKVVQGEENIRRLMSFFPNAGQHLESGIAGLWGATITLTAISSDGSELKIFIDSEMRFWNEGEDDWPIRPGFREYIREVFGGAWPLR